MPPKRKFSQTYSRPSKQQRYSYIRQKPTRIYKQLTMKATPYVNLKRQIHYFKRSCDLGNVVLDTNTPTLIPQPLTFRLNQLPASTEFTDLFDNYRITYVKLMIRLNVSPDAQSPTTAVYPRILYVRDYDDSVIPSSVDVLRQYGNCQQKVLNPNENMVITLKPAIRNLVSRDTSGQVVYSPKWKQWIDCAHSDTLHYGLKYAIENCGNSNYTLNFQATYWFQCKDTR